MLILRRIRDLPRHAAAGVTRRTSLPIRAFTQTIEGFAMGPGWIAVITILAFVAALAIFNILEKGRVD
jgi:hypothetical protein